MRLVPPYTNPFHLIPLINFIHQHDSTVITKCCRNSWPLLRLALDHGHKPHIIEHLISIGVNPTKQDEDYDTPLAFVCFDLGNEDEALSNTNLNGDSIFDHSRKFETDMLNTLLLADHECQDSNVVIRNKQKIGKNPLHNIMQCKQLSATFIAYNRTCHLAIEVITDKLIAAGYNIDAQDEYGNTPAHYALMLHERPTLYMVPLLRKYNADLGIANRRGQNPWQCAHSYYEWLVVENESKQIPYRIARTLMPSDHEDIADFSVQDDDDDESMD